MMSDTLENQKATERLDVLDPGLPFLASQAAIEINGLLLGKNVALSAVHQLAERLEAATERVVGTDQHQSLMDPATLSVFNSAVAASGQSKATSLEEVAATAWRIATSLQSTQSAAPDHDELRRLGAFCNHLAECVMAHERSLYEMYSPNRNWS